MTTTVSGSATLLGQVLDVSSGRISIGAPTGTPDGLVLSGGSLAALLGATDLRLRSYSSIDFYGDVALGGRNADGTFTLASLLLDASGLNSSTGANVTGPPARLHSPTHWRRQRRSRRGWRTLDVASNTLTFGAGTKATDGFDTIQVSASTAIVGRGAGSIDFGSANLVFNAPRLTADSGASQDWTTAGTFTLTGTPASGGFDDTWRAPVDHCRGDHSGRPDRPGGRIVDTARDDRRCHPDVGLDHAGAGLLPRLLRPAGRHRGRHRGARRRQRPRMGAGRIADRRLA